MGHLHQDEWEFLVERAETEPDLEKVRQYVEDVETAMLLDAMDGAESRNGHVDHAVSRKICDRLLRIKRDRLKWPDPFIRDSSDDAPRA